MPRKKTSNKTEAQRKKARRAKESEEQRRARREARNLADRRRRATQSEEVRQKRLEARNMVDHMKRATETEAERKERLKVRNEARRQRILQIRDTRSERKQLKNISANTCQHISMEDYKYLFKVVLIGNAGVGKTCLVRRFTQGLFPPGQGATIGVDFMIKSVEIEGDKVKLQIWDTAGQERFRSITQSYYRSANALIVVYDVCCQASFDSLIQWINEIETHTNSKVLTYLVGNKIDQINRREIPTNIGQQFADRYEMTFLETSAKEADNVEKLFFDIARELTKQAKAHELRPHNNKAFPSGETTPISSYNCCRT